MSTLTVEASHHKSVNLGLKLAGSRDLNQMSVFVCGIQPGSIIERDGHIEVGDQLLEVSDNKFRIFVLLLLTYIQDEYRYPHCVLHENIN